MDLDSIIISIIRRFPGCVFVVVSVVHGILVVREGDLSRPRVPRHRGSRRTQRPYSSSLCCLTTPLSLLFMTFTLFATVEAAVKKKSYPKILLLLTPLLLWYYLPGR